MPFGNLVAKDALCNHIRNTNERSPKLVSLQRNGIQVSLSTLVLRGMHSTLKLSADCNLC